MISALNRQQLLNGNKMKYTILLFLLSAISIVGAQSFKTYEVKKEENLSQIAQKFEVELTEILNYNPDVSRYTTLKGKTLVIPLLNSADQVESFETYAVSPKETLYSIAKQFKVEVETIINYNTFLKDRGLDLNDTLQIPVLKRPANLENQSLKNSNFSSLKHLVQPKETKYGIAKTYGISVDELNALNPEKAVLQPGDYVMIKRQISQPDSLQNNKKISYVNVQSKQDIQLLKQKFELSDEVLSQLNPAYRLGNFSSDFMLKIPRSFSKLDKRIDLSKQIIDNTPKRIALLLPFNLHKFAYDSINKSKVLMNQRITRISLDLFEGARAAVDSAKQLGLFTNLEAFDTAMQNDTLSEILQKNNFSSFDAVVGPVTPANIKTTVNHLSADSIPLILPITNSPVNAKHVFNSVPLDRYKEELIITYINQHQQDSLHLVYLADSLNVEFKQKLSYSFPDAIEMEMQENYLEFEELKEILDQNKINWFVLDTDDLGIAEAVVSYLEALRKEDYRVKLLMPSNQVLADEISNFYLAKLNYVYGATSFDVAAYQLKQSNAQKNNFKSKYFLRGFDLTLDIIMRLAASPSFYDTIDLGGFTEYFQNKFYYEYDTFENVHQNSAVYLVEYQSDLSLEVIEVVSTN